MEVLCIRVNGGLAPQTDEEAEKLKGIRLGASVKVTVTRETNPKFRRKWWALAQFAFGLWSESMSDMEWNGQEVQRNFDRFRRDLTILAGHYHPVFKANGDMVVEADSLGWARMDEETFERFYSATIDAVLGKILKHSKLTGDDLRAYVDRVMAFD